jgi:hypothetical protein
MEKRRRTLKPRVKSRAPRKSEAQLLEESLLADGAVEIPQSEWNKEPYKTWLKGIRRNGKFVCD